MDLNLKDRVAVITGGAAGIGEAIARALAAEGSHVFILDRDEGAARKAAAALADNGHRAQSVACDVLPPGNDPVRERSRRRFRPCQPSSGR